MLDFAVRLGLMGRAHLPEGGALIFPGEKAVHTHFMRFPIDVVFYDRDMVVVDVIDSLRPWRFSDTNSTGRPDHPW